MQELRFDLPHKHIGALAFGDPHKPLMLALHGWLDNAASFIPLAPLLSEYRVIALDFIGHGNSSHRSPDAHYHQLDFVHDVHELVTQQGWQKFVLLGHSMGGIVGSLYTASFPERVSHYITIESFGPMTKTAQSSAEQMRESIESRLKVQQSDGRHPDNFQRVVQARAHAGSLSLTNAELLVARNLDRVGEQLRWRTDRRLRSISSLRVTEDQAEYFLRSIQCPTMAIQGSQGYTSMADKFQQRASFVRDLQLVMCDGGHHVHMDNPTAVASHILQFLSANGAISQE